ncbi:unnamed protein product [Gemmataceae bacterium]|nr:unnamed protein product [Gemmataceae bacterium]VTT99068.1 unnamed protein product [Gemmataceae bacterium]
MYGTDPTAEQFTETIVAPVGFTDAAGRVWNVALTPAVVYVAKNRGIDCRAVAHGGAVNFHTVAVLLGLACSEQTAARGIGDEEFVKLVNDSLAPACAALDIALRDYFPTPPKETDPC